jgi:hypothetical protein
MTNLVSSWMPRHGKRLRRPRCRDVAPSRARSPPDLPVLQLTGDRVGRHLLSLHVAHTYHLDLLNFIVS